MEEYCAEFELIEKRLEFSSPFINPFFKPASPNHFVMRMVALEIQLRNFYLRIIRVKPCPVVFMEKALLLLFDIYLLSYRLINKNTLNEANIFELKYILQNFPDLVFKISFSGLTSLLDFLHKIGEVAVCFGQVFPNQIQPFIEKINGLKRHCSLEPVHDEQVLEMEALEYLKVSLENVQEKSFNLRISRKNP